MQGHATHLTDSLGSFALPGDAGVILVLFVAGLVGGVVHCAGMCGPFFLGQASARLAMAPTDRMSEITRLGGTLLLPYHLGRATAYAALGAIATAVVGGLAALAGDWVAFVFLLTAAILFMLLGARGLSLPVPEFAERPVGWRGYLLGLGLGFLPCGLLYGPLAAAAGTGRPATDALAMAAFTIGTAPPLFAVGLAGHFAARRWRAAFGRIAPMLLLINGMGLTYFAGRIIE